MTRDLARLASGEFDLLVVGGGIHGLAVAYDAAQRGLSTGLVERMDFGAATSFNHLKTLHGGLRYLQTGDLRRMRESIRERRAFARIAPELVAPVPFVMATGGTGTRSALAMRMALAADAIVAADRNDRVPEALRLPRGRIIPSADCAALFAGAADTGGHPGAMWYDYVTVQGDRLTLAFAEAAASHGAVLANYTQAGAATSSAAPLVAVRATDALTGDVFDVRARVVVNAAGPWVSSVLGAMGVGRTWPLLKAMNLVTSRPARPAALVRAGRSGRALVLLPWHGRTLVGTSESPGQRTPEDQQALGDEVARFVEEANEAFPELRIGPGEITLVHRGVVPAGRRGDRLTLLGQSAVVDHAADGHPALVSIVSVKYTTARAVAERAVDLVMAKLGRRPVACRTGETPLPAAVLDGLPPRVAAQRAVEAEMARTLADVVVRRVGAGARGYPGDAVVQEYAAAVAALLRWTPERTASEVRAVRRFYDIA